MKLTKLATSLILATTLTGVGALSTTPVKAASWHKGTPKVMRGTWKNEYHQPFKVIKSGLNYGGKVGTVKTTYKLAGHHKYQLKVNGHKVTATITAHHMKFSGDSFTR
ncbi:hypothetical protein EFM54_08540 [Lentilactobacillus buchneri]|uniref:hypothetical protein n=1 Tax=Lentilactobacillus buchneri TaxID=1581 RepID=UPI0021A8331A|nr:hypothetical protein [Lentilactobacillus buchneri]MCT2899024.1 hypothetical protein [Lentilactobacillus buchneri]